MPFFTLHTQAMSAKRYSTWMAPLPLAAGSRGNILFQLLFWMSEERTLLRAFLRLQVYERRELQMRAMRFATVAALFIASAGALQAIRAQQNAGTRLLTTIERNNHL